jgi:3-methyladenine DNA glycosylase AlkD
MPATRSKKIVQAAAKTSPRKVASTTSAKTPTVTITPPNEMSAKDLEAYIIAKGDGKRGKLSAGYFQTKPGGYGFGDVFVGLSMPQIREISKDCSTLSDDKLRHLLNSDTHEVRMTAVVNLTDEVKKKSAVESIRQKYYQIYKDAMDGPKGINNWDLVDVSAHFVVGDYLHLHKKTEALSILRSWVHAGQNLWTRRVGIVSTWNRIRNGDFEWILDLAPRVLGDTHDLIHKATGWMLREMGKKNVTKLRTFLDEHAAKMPRVMLRYSIEKFGDAERKKYLNKQAK